jgi:tetratricopeptide (TPR) repeat protein
MNNQFIAHYFQRWYKYLFIAIPALFSAMAVAIYYPAMRYIFMFDDLPTIINYMHIRYIDFKGQFFGNPRWISRLLNQITYHFWHNDPYGYRIIDLLLHIVIGVLVFTLVYRLFSYQKKNAFLRDYSLLLASLSCMLFLLHPVQTQTVTYITQMRLEGLVAFFSLLVTNLFVLAVTTNSKMIQFVLYVSAFIAMAFAAGTKEVVVVLPALLVLTDWFFIAESDWQSFKSRLWVHALFCLILYGVLASYGYLSPNFIKNSSVSALVHNNRGNILTKAASEHITLYPFFISQFKVILHYVFIFFWPFRLSFDYDVLLAQHLYNLDVLIPLFVLLGMFFGLSLLYRRQKVNAFVYGFMWFFITMLPRTSIFPSTELICDYKTYPASFGMMVLLAIIIARVALWVKEKVLESINEQRRSVIVAGSLLILSVAITGYSGVRNTVWRSELDFWGDVIQKAPKARAYNNYAIALWELGKEQEAMVNFHKAIEKDDWYAEPHVNLATIYQVKNNVEKALEHYKRAIEIGEGHPELFNNLGMLHFSNQSWTAAEYCLKQAIELRPYYSKPNLNLGKLYQLQNRREAALACYEAAIKGDKPDAEVFYLYGSLCFEMGRLDQAIASLEHLDKNYQNTAFLLGCCYYNRPCYAKAAEYLGFAYQKDPNNRVYAYNYAQALINLRKYQEALPIFETCSQGANAHPYASLHRVKCLYEVGKKDEAKKALKVLVASNPPKQILDDALRLQKECKFI